jgi:hypothetical protein
MARRQGAVVSVVRGAAEGGPTWAPAGSVRAGLPEWKGPVALAGPSGLERKGPGLCQLLKARASVGAHSMTVAAESERHS